ncbi:uncharacterized protein LOC125957092 [Anopheles darlingi]|uniref:uncharacterized protein LOC125957092 n=1 Tax=Anopheles darlingi TaxID=43151 RepID=UPI0021003263|nr:uncharacterized protein LOC125957092 [Anopheles darlingi]
MADSNATAVKKTQHGIEFQKHITTLFALAYIEEVNHERLEFKITPEHKDSGKFDDIRYEFKYKTDFKENLFLVQVKHSQTYQSTIKLNDFIPNRKKSGPVKFKTNSKEQPFLIQTYFTSFYDQKISDADMYRLILCTNNNIDIDAEKIWNLVQEPVDTLDNHLLGLFKTVRGKCYHLKYNKSNSQTLTEMFEDCSESARLAKLLVNYAILSKREINRKNRLFAKYHNALKNIFELVKNSNEKQAKKVKEEERRNYKFKIDILTSSGEVFITEFKKNYQEAFGLNSIADVWEHLRGQTVRVSAMYMQSNGEFESLFPNDRVTPENIHSFCERFRLVCGISSLTDLKGIFETHLQKSSFARCLKNDSNAFPDNRMIENSMAVQEIQKMVADCFSSRDKESFGSKDVIGCLNQASLSIDIFKKDIITREKYFKSKSLFRIDEECLKTSELYKVMNESSFLMLNTYEIEYGSTILFDIIDIQRKNTDLSLFFDASHFLNNPEQFANFFITWNYTACIMIVYNNKCAEQDNVKFLEDIATKKRKNWIFLINRTDNTNIKHTTALSQTDQNIYQEYNTSFHIRDLEEASRDNFFREKVTLCDTIILAGEIFKIECNLCLLEHVIEQINRGKQMEAPIEREYEKIMKANFVERYCMQNTKQENATHETDEKQILEIKEVISETQQKKMSSGELVAHLKKFKIVNEIFETESNLNDASPKSQNGVEEQANKVIIVKDGKKRGKSTYLKWLARNLRQQNRESWITFCNLSDHSIISRIIDENPTNGEETESRDLRILYQLICLCLGKLPPDCIGKNAFTNPKVNSSENFKENATLDGVVKFLVFRQQLHKSKLVLLFDGLDDLKSPVQKKVLKLLSSLAKLCGVCKLYITSCDSDAIESVFKQTFEFTFPIASYQLQPPSLKQIAAMLHNMFESKFQNDLKKEEKFAYLKLLCLTIINRFGENRNNLFEFMYSVNSIKSRADQYINNLGIVNVEMLNAMLEKMQIADILKIDDEEEKLIHNLKRVNLSKKRRLQP